MPPNSLERTNSMLELVIKSPKSKKPALALQGR
jgi:hypothetical protein